MMFVSIDVGSGVHLEEALTQEMTLLRQRVSQLEMTSQARRQDLILLSQHVNRSLPLSKPRLFPLYLYLTL